MITCTWHVISENDSLSTKNGSAILTVARALQREDWSVGGRSYIIGSDHLDNNLPRSVGLLREKQRSRMWLIADVLLKTLSGDARLHPTRIARKDDALHGPDIVVAHNQPWLVDEIRQTFPNARTVLYIHNRILQKVPRWAGHRLLKKFDFIVSVSEYIRQDLEGRFGPLPEDVSHVVRNGVDPTRFHSEVEEDVEASSTDLLFVGRVVPEKGPQVLLAALGELAASGLFPKTRIVGSSGFDPRAPMTEFEDSLRLLVEKGNLAVTFEKAVCPSQIPKLMNSARVVAVPSVWPDPCPLVVLEALASKAAVVATFSGGIPEIVGGGAVIVQASNPSELAGVLKQLLSDEEFRKTIIAEGVKVAEARKWPDVHLEYRLAINEAACTDTDG